MGTFNQCSLYTVRMASSSIFCSFLLLVIAIATSLASPRIRRDIPTARSLTWRMNVNDYPEKEAEKLIAELESENITQYFLSSEKIKELSRRTMRQEQNQTYENMCSSVMRKRIPKSVEIDGNEFYVLNPDSRLIQYFETEECNTNVDDAPCNFVDKPENTYKARCKQEYITRELYLMDKNNPGNLHNIPIKIESCCSCYVYN